MEWISITETTAANNSNNNNNNIPISNTIYFSRFSCGEGATYKPAMKRRPIFH
jgi:hypothetical protein